MPAKRLNPALGDTAHLSSSHSLKGFGFRNRRRFFLLLLPIILLFSGLRLNIGSVVYTWKNFTSGVAFHNPPDLGLLKSFLARFIPGKENLVYFLYITAPPETQIERYGLVELNLETDIPFTNPYSPKDIDLRVLFTAPSGRRLAAGAFWYQDFDSQTRLAMGKPGWKVRFTPDESGEWSAIAIAPALNIESKQIKFSVTGSERKGFVRINPTNPSYLATDDGELFFPIGVNMAWWEKGHDPLQQYRQWLDQFSKNGGNTIRVWMAAWSFGIEWKDSGLGNYDRRQYQAWLLDQLFKLAAQYHVKVILVLMNHGPLSLTVNSEWKDNPYNRAQGGSLDSPEQFVTDRQAVAYFQQRLSYIINRWGYSPDLLAWEWFNEVDLTPITDKALIPWLEEMTAYLRQRDIYHHLTTNSFSVRSWSDTWHIPWLDIVQLHNYAEKLSPEQRDPADTAPEQLQAVSQDIPNKPVMLGEFGYSARDYGDDIEKTGIQLHNGIWATTFSGYAGSGMYWWWDTYIAANNLWHQFKGLADFMDGEDLALYRPGPTLEVLDSHGRTAPVTGVNLRGTVTLVWLRSDGYTVTASLASKKSDPPQLTYSPPKEAGLTLNLTNIAAGKYSVFWYDPQAAQWLSEQQVESVGSLLSIPIPAFSADLAAKIVLNR